MEGPRELIKDLEQKHINFANKWFRYPNNSSDPVDCLTRVRSEFPELTEIQAQNLVTYIVTVTSAKLKREESPHWD